MGRKKKIWNYSKKEIETELSKFPKETIDIYRGSIADKTNGDLKQIKEIIDDKDEMVSLWYKLIAVKIYKELGGK